MGIGLGIGRGHAPKSEPTLWLLQDEFATDLAAGSVNGTAAEPGPGTRTVVDTAGNKVYISSGSLAINGAGSWDDTYISYASVGAWTAGRVLLTRILSTGGESLVDFIRTNWSDGVLFGDYLRAWSPLLNIIPTTPGYWHDLAIVTRASGHFLFLRRHGETTWALRWMRNNSVSATMPVSVQAASGALYVSHLRIPVDLWLPTPLASDGFGSAFGTTDGMGHAEGIAGGIGAGGSGKTWSNGGSTWSVSGGKAINTPVPGSELLTNGNMETGDPPTSWTAIFCTADGVADERTGGSGSQSVALTATNIGEPCISQGALSLSPGGWYKLSGWMKQTIGSSGVKLRLRDGHVGGYFIETAKTNSSTWTFASATGVATWTLHSMWAMFSNSASVSDVGYFDDLSFKQLALSELLSVSNLSCSDVFADVAITRPSAGVQVGLALNWNSLTAPTDGIIVYLADTFIHIDKYVAGVFSRVSYAACTYSAGARLVVAKSGSEYRIYYNSVFIVAVTVSDASIISNTLHGLFSTDASNTLDDYVCYATGSGGEYAELDKWS